MYILLIVFTIFATAFGSEWVIDSSTDSGMIIGVGVGGVNAAIAAANSDSQGPIRTLYDGSKWKQELGVIQAGMVLDGAISKDGKTSVYSCMGGLQISTDSGATYSSKQGLIGLSQDVHMFGSDSNSMGAIGNFKVLPSSDDMKPGTYNGIAFSTDGAGVKWDFSTIPNENYPRYGDFPSDNTWYVSAGMWNSTESTTTITDNRDMHLSHRLKVDLKNMKKVMKRDLTEGTDGWYGAIYKTNDAGKTWTNVYKSLLGETWYFNQIACPTEDLCVAVGEGQQGSLPYVVAVVSNDGGKTWKKTLESNDYPSLMGVVMTSATEGFITPANSGRVTGTDFLVTTDAGQTWTLSQTLGSCYCIDVDSKGGLGVASCLTQADGAIAMYKP